MGNNETSLELTILMPCLNEAETLAICIGKAMGFLEKHNISGEVLIADNGSTDGSQQIAKDLGARVVDIPERGYGAALIGGSRAAYGEYVIMGDADDSYDFTNLMPFVERLRAGDDLVMGNRWGGGIAKGAMPPLHRYFGNPLISFLGRLFFSSKVKDFYCGLRGYNASKIRALNLRSTGMEYALEMIAQATMNGYTISEVPTTLSPDGRSRPPHLRSWRDGWRSLKFYLIYSPNWLFLYPGLVLFVIGLTLGTAVTLTQFRIFGAALSMNTLLYSAAMVIVGYNLISFHVFAKVYAIQSKYIKTEKGLLTKVSTETYVVLGLFIAVVGIVMSVIAVALWGKESFGDLILSNFMRLTIPAVTFIIVGVQLLFSGFFIELLKIKPLDNS